MVRKDATRAQGTITHDNERPLVRGVERDFKHFGVLLLMFVEVREIAASKANKACLSGITEDGTFLKGNVCLVEFDA